MASRISQIEDERTQYDGLQHQESRRAHRERQHLPSRRSLHFGEARLGGDVEGGQDAQEEAEPEDLGHAGERGQVAQRGRPATAEEAVALGVGAPGVHAQLLSQSEAPLQAGQLLGRLYPHPADLEHGVLHDFGLVTRGRARQMARMTIGDVLPLALVPLVGSNEDVVRALVELYLASPRGVRLAGAEAGERPEEGAELCLPGQQHGREHRVGRGGAEHPPPDAPV
mmetsp:Transcript_58621/g.117313  ORF Transcript_58621/g.117313 Transcript_58621/m.117313 type:complete len:226 (-) Transcript_58621:295-972(-)